MSLGYIIVVNTQESAKFKVAKKINELTPKVLQRYNNSVQDRVIFLPQELFNLIEEKLPPHSRFSDEPLQDLGLENLMFIDTTLFLLFNLKRG